MKASTATFLSGLCLSGVRGAALAARDSNSWAGSSLYMLHGLSSDDQDNYISQMADAGAKVIRVWVTGTQNQGDCAKGFTVATHYDELEPGNIGDYNDAVLDALDTTIAKIAAAGMKALISPHDGNAFGINSNDTYMSTYGDDSLAYNDPNRSGSFYTDPTAAQQIDARYAHILNYKSPTTGSSWAQWTDAIMGIDLENEPMQQGHSAADSNDSAGWLCGRASAMRKILGENSIQMVTGGIGGDQSHEYNFLDAAMQCDQIDIMAAHAYVGTTDFWPSFIDKNLPNVENAGKLLMIEEFGIGEGAASFDDQAAAINAKGVPWTYWQITEYDAGSCGDDCCNGGWDSYEIGLNDARGNPQQAMADAANAAGAQDWTGIIY